MKNYSWLKNILFLTVLLALLVVGFMSSSTLKQGGREVSVSLGKSQRELFEKKINKKQERVVIVKVVREPPPDKTRQVDKKEVPKQQVAKQQRVKKKEEMSTPISKKIAAPAISKRVRKNVVADSQRGDGPALVARYELPVSRYLEWARSRGGILALYDARAGKIACRIEPDGSFVVEFQNNNLSARARRLTVDFPQSTVVLRQAEKRFGRSLYEILLLMPIALDNEFNLQIWHIIESAGQEYNKVVVVRLVYLNSRSNGHLQVRVDSLETVVGGVTINRQFTL